MNFPFDDDIVLENDRVRLMPLKIGDTPKLLSVAIQDKNLLRYSPVAIHSEALLDNYINGWVQERKNKTRYPFIIFDKTQQSYGGSTSFMNISNAHDRLEIGSTWIGKDFQRTGLNRNCKYLLMSYAFEQLGLERLEFLTDERNIQSRTAIEKIGGKLDGILRHHILMLDGYRRNSYCYSILHEEWPDIKRERFGLL